MPKKEEKRRTVDIQEAMQITGWSRPTLYNLHKEGLVEGTIVYRGLQAKRVFYMDALQAFLKTHPPEQPDK